jgi:hypothetical protein
MDAFFCVMICKSWACFVLGQASDLKKSKLWEKSQVSLTMQGIKHKLRGEKSYPGELQPRASPSPNLKNTSWKSEAPSSADSNASKIDEFEDLYKEIWQKYWAMCSLKSALDRLQCRSRTGITHSIKVRWGWINPWWKDNFMRHAWKLLFSTWSELDREENLGKKRQR